MQADDARQQQQPERLLQCEARAVHAPGQRGARRLALLVLAILALLHIEPVGTPADGNLLAGFRMHAEASHPFLQGVAILLARLDRETARVLARGVVRAADEAAEAAELQAEPAIAAGRTGARIGAVGLGREEMLPKILIERADDVEIFSSLV